MKKYAAELEGHITKDEGNVTDLDPFAVNLLKPKRETYKALDERNSYLKNIYKETVSENEQLREERDKLASKEADSDAVIEQAGQGICGRKCQSKERKCKVSEQTVRSK